MVRGSVGGNSRDGERGSNGVWMGSDVFHLSLVYSFPLLAPRACNLASYLYFTRHLSPAYLPQTTHLFT